jgi:hypothetical protein
MPGKWVRLLNYLEGAIVVALCDLDDERLDVGLDGTSVDALGVAALKTAQRLGLRSFQIEPKRHLAMIGARCSGGRTGRLGEEPCGSLTRSWLGHENRNAIAPPHINY